MTLAAADYAEGKKDKDGFPLPCPPELMDYRKLRLFSGMGFDPGGIDDQPINRTLRVMAARNAYDAVMRYRAEKESRKGKKKSMPMPADVMEAMAYIWKLRARRDKENG